MSSKEPDEFTEGVLTLGVPLGHQLNNVISLLDSHRHVMAEDLKANERLESLGLAIDCVLHVARRVGTQLACLRHYDSDCELGYKSFKTIPVKDVVKAGLEKCNKFTSSTLACEFHGDPSATVRTTDSLQYAFFEIFHNVYFLAPKLKEPPVAKVSWRTEGEFVIVRVEDNGPGFKAEEISTLLKPCRTATNYTGKLGLGIPVAKIVTSRNRGKFRLISGDRGIVEFRLPTKVEGGREY